MPDIMRLCWQSCVNLHLCILASPQSVFFCNSAQLISCNITCVFYILLLDKSYLIMSNSDFISFRCTFDLSSLEQNLFLFNAKHRLAPSCQWLIFISSSVSWLLCVRNFKSIDIHYLQQYWLFFCIIALANMVIKCVKNAVSHRI